MRHCNISKIKNMGELLVISHSLGRHPIEISSLITYLNIYLGRLLKSPTRHIIHF